MYFNSFKTANIGYSRATKNRRRVTISYVSEQKLKYFYKFRAVFNGEYQSGRASYSQNHSMLASLVLDYKPVSNENEIVTSLRENYKKIIEFSKDDSKQFVDVKNIDVIYQGEYDKMLKHILNSDKNLPSNIDVSSIKKIAEDLTYRVYKKNK